MKNRVQNLGAVRVALAVGALGVFVCSCNMPGASTSFSSSQPSGVNPGGTSTAIPSGFSGGSPSSPTVAIGSVSQQQMNLGVSLTVPVTIQSTNGYSGPVSLSINNKVLAANDPMNTVAVSISPASVNLSSGGMAQASVSIMSSASSPDLSTYVELVAGTPNGQVVGQIPFQINAVFEVDILDSGDLDSTGIENWSIPGGTTTKFTTHPKGITILFVNKDPVEKSGFYRIHSSATAFLHQGGEGLGIPGSSTPNTNDATAAGSSMIATTLGPVYSVTVTSQTAQLSNQYYDHNNENSSKAGRTLVFNAFAPPPVIGNSGNPNASFAFIQKNLINSACMSCHVTNPSQGGGNDFGSYAGVFAQVQPGSALGSPFYVQIAPGGSMPLGDPGSVSAALVQDVEDWINDGAKDN